MEISKKKNFANKENALKLGANMAILLVGFLAVGCIKDQHQAAQMATTMAKSQENSPKSEEAKKKIKLFGHTTKI